MPKGSDNIFNIFVRPGDISISKDNNKRIKGKIVHKQFLGAFTTCFIEVDHKAIHVNVIKSQDNDWCLGEGVYLTSKYLS
ncbi:MAG: TOBE domain-containing protein [Firmicutes bacterium]|nr:TOBE domain-containing protein [Bacillota bacterium]